MLPEITVPADQEAERLKVRDSQKHREEERQRLVTPPPPPATHGTSHHTNHYLALPDFNLRTPLLRLIPDACLVLPPHLHLSVIFQLEAKRGEASLSHECACACVQLGRFIYVQVILNQKSSLCPALGLPFIMEKKSGPDLVYKAALEL